MATTKNMDTEGVEELSDEIKHNFDILVTRAASYFKPDTSSLPAPPDSNQTPSGSGGNVKPKSNRGKNFFLCKIHYEEIGKWSCEPRCAGCTDCIIYKSRPHFRNGLLPQGIEVMEYLITQRFTNWGKQFDNIKSSSKDLILQWIFCNVYPIGLFAVEAEIRKMDDEYQKLKKMSSMESVSCKMVINKNLDLLMSRDPKEMYDFVKPAAEIKEIKMEWKEKVKEQQKLGMDEKDTANLKVESVKYELLESLKSQDVPGPFTHSTEVIDYGKLPLDDKIKNKRMYNEVKFARLTSMSLKPTAAVFRLKRNSRNLETREYIDNLCAYLDSTRVCKTLTLDDLSNALHGISAKAGIAPSLKTNGSYMIGEHVAAFWFEKKSFKWYLGVVDGFDENEEQVIISYLSRKDNGGYEWEFPEDAHVYPTSTEQILASSIAVTYMCSVKIQCRIVSQDLVSEINSKIKSLS
jgi:hypothetical protein